LQDGEAMNLRAEKIEDMAKDIKAEMTYKFYWDALYDFFRWEMDFSPEQSESFADAVIRLIINGENNDII
jgi:hypothetical protein